MSDTKVSLKLLIDTNSNKVLFAEAGKDFVDFLFNFLALPVGTVIRLLTKESMVGCIGNLYESVENLSETYMQPDQSKNSLLQPKADTLTGVTLLLRNDAPEVKKFYICASTSNVYGNLQCRSVANYPTAVCPNCGRNINIQANYIAPVATAVASSSGQGYVKGVVTYMVMDDLVVKPLSAISSITLLNKYNVKEVGALEEKVVDLGMEEGLKLLKASLQWKTVLTSVFFGNI